MPKSNLSDNKKQKRKKGAGRPRTLDEGTKKFAKHLAREGNTKTEISKKMQIARSTLYRWKEADQEFCNALNAATDTANEIVKMSLFQRATGCTIKEKKFVSVYDGPAMGSHLEEVEDEKVILPDVQAIKFWLVNNDPDNWNEKFDIDLIRRYEGMSEDQLIGELGKMGYQITRSFDEVEYIDNSEDIQGELND